MAVKGERVLPRVRHLLGAAVTESHDHAGDETIVRESGGSSPSPPSGTHRGCSSSF